MIKKFEEFVNEGLISDYKKQIEAANKEISGADKKFVFEVMGAFDEIGLPFVLTCKNCMVYNENVDIDHKYLKDKREKKVKFSEVESLDDIHVTDSSILEFATNSSSWVKPGYKHKNLFFDIFKWFKKKYNDDGKDFGGAIRVDRMIEYRVDIKKDIL